MEHKVRVLIFSTTDVCTIFHSKKNAVTCHKSTQVVV
jgi:hypothetical protein